MIESPEIKNVILQLYEKYASGEVLEFAERFYSRQEGLLFIGTDPDEWFMDHESIISFYKEAANAGLKIQMSDLKAYSEGTVGWAADRVKVKLPKGSEVLVRHTFILHKELGEWKIIHAHISVGMPNEEIWK
jgi:hypothetical protein